MQGDRYSVVIVSFNHAATLPACLRAVALLQPAPERVVVVDNASSDGSASVVAAHAGDLPLAIVRHHANLGFAVAANAGLAATATPWARR